MYKRYSMDPTLTKSTFCSVCYYLKVAGLSTFWQPNAIPMKVQTLFSHSVSHRVSLWLFEKIMVAFPLYLKVLYPLMYMKSYYHTVYGSSHHGLSLLLKFGLLMSPSLTLSHFPRLCNLLFVFHLSCLVRLSRDLHSSPHISSYTTTLVQSASFWVRGGLWNKVQLGWYFSTYEETTLCASLTPVGISPFQNSDNLNVNRLKSWT